MLHEIKLIELSRFDFSDEPPGNLVLFILLVVASAF